MTRSQVAAGSTGRLAFLVGGAVFALLAVGAVWYFVQGGQYLAPQPLADNNPPVSDAGDTAATASDEPVTPGGDPRVAGGVEGASDDEPFEWLPAIEGTLSLSRLGPAFDLSSIHALSGTVSIGEEKKHLMIPVFGDRFHLEYAAQDEGPFVLEDGSHQIPRSALDSIDTATIELVAPVLAGSVGALGFLDPSDPTSPPKRRITLAFGERALVLTLQAPPAVRLWATDAASGGSLDGASVYLHSAARNGKLHFDNSFRVARGERGQPPIARELRRGAVIPSPGDSKKPEEVGLEVRVAGYSPGHVTANFRDGGDLHVALHQSGSVIVKFSGGPVSGGKVSLRSAGGAQAELTWRESRPLNRLQEITFDSVPPGQVLVSVEGALSEPKPRPVDALLDLQEVSVTSGGVTTVQLRAVSDALANAQAAGQILLPRAWTGIASIDLTLVPRQGQEVQPIECTAKPSEDRAPSGYRTFAFDAGEIPLGRYSIELQALLWESQDIVPPGGTTGLLVRVPEPTTFHFRLVDRDTGQTAPHRELYVGLPPPLPGRPERSRVITRAASEGAFTFQGVSKHLLLTAPETAEYGQLWYWLQPTEDQIELTKRSDI